MKEWQGEFVFEAGEGTAGETIQERFDRFHAANPWVLRRLIELAEEAREHGATRVGVGHLFEVLRWRHRMATHDDAAWKLNNDYRSRYARLIQEQRPDLGQLIELRRLRA